MSAQVFSLPCQTKGSRKAFLEWASIDLSSKLSLLSADHSILTLPVGIGSTHAIFKTHQ